MASAAELRSATSPLQSPRQRHLRLFGARTGTASTFEHHDAPGERVVDKQWRSQFSSRAGPFVESGRVDRTKELRGLGADRSDGEDGVKAAADSPSSPMLLWGLPREQILDFIRQSLLPSSWVEYVQTGPSSDSLHLLTRVVGAWQSSQCRRVGACAVSVLA